jgi:hypothetical protein
VNAVSVSQQLARRDRHFLHSGNNPNVPTPPKRQPPWGKSTVTEKNPNKAVLNVPIAEARTPRLTVSGCGKYDSDNSSTGDR